MKQAWRKQNARIARPRGSVDTRAVDWVDEAAVRGSFFLDNPQCLCDATRTTHQITNPHSSTIEP